MKRRIPPLTALRAFEAAGRLVNLSRAAEELNVTPGAISRQVRLLENHLGVHLFDRSNAKLQLTARSADYARALTDAFARIEVSTQQLQSDRRQRQLKIACSMTFALRWLMPRLPQFNKEHPGLALRLSMAPHPKDVFDLSDFDMAIVVSDGKRSELVSEALFENELIVVGSPTSPLMRKPGRTPADLVGTALLSSSLRPDDWDSWFATLAPDINGLALEKTVFANSTLVYQAAQAGLGYAVARLPLVLDDLISGQLVPLFPVLMVDRECYYMIYSKITESANLRLFRRWVKKEGDAYCKRSRAHFADVTRVPQARLV